MAINDAIQSKVNSGKLSVGTVCLLVGLLLGQNVGSSNVFDIATKVKNLGEQPASAAPAATSTTVAAVPKAPAQ